VINLLPPAIKREYRYAAINTSLVRWIFGTAVALIGVGIIGTFGMLILRQTTDDTQAQIDNTQLSLARAHLSQTNADIKNITGSVKLVEQVLGQEILFSKLLKQMATALPNGTSLTGLNIPAATGALDVTVAANDYATATQVQINLASPANQIFSKADIQSVKCGSTDPNSAYPCTITLRAQFSPNNPFLFINQKAAKS